MSGPESADIAVVGAGAAGLFAAIHAGRALREHGSLAKVVAFDGARKLGAKILVAGGGRCNVTHHEVTESAYAGSSRNAIKKVLRQFTVEDTVAFFAERGVTLKREDTGKLFPTTDDAHTILNALLTSAHDAGVELVHPWRVDRVERTDSGFLIHPEPSALSPEPVAARRLILATGGKALPKSGSDGHGYSIAQALGHTITPNVFPALVPLILDKSRSFITELSGLTLPATLELWSGTGKKLVSFTNSTLCTHFGLSGPSVLDISRYHTDARRSDANATLTINWLPGRTFEQIDTFLAETPNPRTTLLRRTTDLFPERLARALIEHARLDPMIQFANLKRDDRRALAHAITRTPLPITGDRGFTFAEVTAGGVPLSEIHLDTMESRLCPGLHLCGEICDVDGRIGGFNFQWAWSSGFIAGSAAAAQIAAGPTPDALGHES